VAAAGRVITAVSESGLSAINQIKALRLAIDYLDSEGCPEEVLTALSKSGLSVENQIRSLRMAIEWLESASEQKEGFPVQWSKLRKADERG